jgi:hypothetical protein
MELEFDETTASGWYKPDTRQARAPRHDDFVHPVDVNRGKRPIGWFQSLINKASNPFHSELERQTMLLLDLTPNVASFTSQPETFDYSFANRECPYTPDLRIELRTRKLLFVEVKPEAHYRFTENVVRSRAQDSVIRSAGASYRIITDTYLSREPRKSNVRRLQLYRPIEPHARTSQLIDMLLARRGWATIGELAALAEDPIRGRQTVMSLILRRHLAVDLNSPIGADTIVRRTSR